MISLGKVPTLLGTVINITLTAGCRQAKTLDEDGQDLQDLQDYLVNPVHHVNPVKVVQPMRLLR
jgi:hypothetical protein